jgi:hypothetical protein
MGVINGDVVQLRQTNGLWSFELVVTGDEMTGSGRTYGATMSGAAVPVTLRRTQSRGVGMP